MDDRDDVAPGAREEARATVRQMKQLMKRIGRTSQKGAYKRGTRVVKATYSEGETYPIGSKATVLMSVDKTLNGEIGYFVEWDDLPGAPILIHGSKLRKAPREPRK